MKSLKLFVMSALLTVVGRAYGDELVVTDFSIAAGETKTMSVVLNNPTSDYIAFEIYMSLPTGISIVADDNGYLMVSLNSNRASRHIIEVNMIDNGDYHFLCYSNGNDTFKERSGELFTMTLKADDNATSGTFEGIIYNQIFSDPNKQQVDFADYLFSATITGERVLDENSAALKYGTMLKLLLSKVIFPDALLESPRFKVYSRRVPAFNVISLNLKP